MQEILTKFIQFKMPDKVDLTIPIQNQIQPQNLLQSHQNEPPFFCIAGIKEYHDHPAHTGDSWLLHRKKGEGSLGFILDQLYNHSTAIIVSYQFNLDFTYKIPDTK